MTTYVSFEEGKFRQMAALQQIIYDPLKLYKPSPFVYIYVTPLYGTLVSNSIFWAATLQFRADIHYLSFNFCLKPFCDKCPKMKTWNGACNRL